jgi:hypothetical protein
MLKFTCLMIVGAVLSISAPAVAESRAVNISIGSIGGSLDNAEEANNSPSYRVCSRH